MRHSRAVMPFLTDFSQAVWAVRARLTLGVRWLTAMALLVVALGAATGTFEADAPMTDVASCQSTGSHEGDRVLSCQPDGSDADTYQIVDASFLQAHPLPRFMVMHNLPFPQDWLDALHLRPPSRPV